MPNPSDAYLDTLERLEPDITMVDPGAYYASAAISLKRIADSLEFFAELVKADLEKKIDD